MSSAIGSFSGAVTSYRQGKETAKTYKRESAYTMREAELMTEKRGEEIADFKMAVKEAVKRGREAISTTRARYGKSGVVGYEGSSAEVVAEGLRELANMQKRAAEQIARMKYWEKKEYETYWLQALESRRAGHLAFRTGQIGAWTGAIQGVASLASSAYGGATGSGGYAPGSAGSYAHSFLGS